MFFEFYVSSSLLKMKPLGFFYSALFIPCRVYVASPIQANGHSHLSHIISPGSHPVGFHEFRLSPLTKRYS
jgi:hypothetical protein